MRTWESRRNDGTVEFHVADADEAMVERLLAGRPEGATTRLYVDDDAQPTRSRAQDGHRRQRDVQPSRRTDGDIDVPRDAHAGAPGDWRSDLRAERWDDPPLYVGGGTRAPQTAIVNPDPPAFLDARSLRIFGRDQEGRQFSTAIWGAHPQETDWTRDPTPTTHETGDRAHPDHIRRLAGYQQYLDRHYARR